MASIPRYPSLDLIEAVLSQRVESPLSVAARLHDPGLSQNAQVSRDARLTDVHASDDFADGAFARLHGLEDAQAGRISKRASSGVGRLTFFQSCFR